MKKGDILWSSIILVLILLLAFPGGRNLYIEYTTRYPYASGFLKFALLSTMGELLTLRLREKQWRKSTGFTVKIFVWGLIGMAITFMFSFYSAGVSALQEAGKLPGGGISAATAFFTSALMNLTFGPAFMIAHRISDTIIDSRVTVGAFPRPGAVLENIAWGPFMSVIIRSLIFFWIPAHTLVFLLPGPFRVLAAAFLSIILGVLLTIAGGKDREEKT